jgi:hypothetical protein
MSTVELFVIITGNYFLLVFVFADYPFFTQVRQVGLDITISQLGTQFMNFLQITYCRVLGIDVTNSNGFWILWLGLLALLYYYSQL